MTPAVTLYSKPSCIQCSRTKAWLTKNGVEFTPVDVTEDPDAYRFITEDLGYQAVPVVVWSTGGDPVHWSGFRPDRLPELLTAVTA